MKAMTQQVAQDLIDEMSAYEARLAEIAGELDTASCYGDESSYAARASAYVDDARHSVFMALNMAHVAFDLVETADE